MTGVSRTSCSSKSVPTRAARRRSASSSRSRSRSGTSAPGRANARLRRSSRPGPLRLGDDVADAAEQQSEDDRGVAGPEVDVALDDRVPEPAQDVGGAVQRVADVGGEASEHARWERLGDGHPQRGLLGAGRGGERARRLGERVEHDPGVQHGARERAEDDPVAAVAVVWCAGHAAALRLEAEQARAGGGDADRPRAVGGERGRHDPGCDRGGGSAAGPAGGPARVPRVAGDAPGHRFRERPEPQLGHRGLADDHRAGGAEATDDLGIGRRGDGERIGSPAREVAGDVDLVLDGDRHPQQRPVLACRSPAVGLVGRRQCAVGEDDAERVELRIERRDPGERETGQVARRDVASAHELDLACDPCECRLGVEHRGNLLRLSVPRHAPRRGGHARTRRPGWTMRSTRGPRHRTRRPCGRTGRGRARRWVRPCGRCRARR